VPKLVVARDVDCIAYHSWEVLRPATTTQYCCGDWTRLTTGNPAGKISLQS